jgi:magnesium transporter
MKKQHSKNKIGLAPGTMVYTGNKQNTNTFIDVFDYTKKAFTEEKFTNIEECFQFKSTNSVTWINIDGLNNIAAIKKIGDHYQLHPLILEDIVHTQQRPKIDEYEDALFVVFKMLYYEKDQLMIEHISLVLGDTYVLSFQEADGDVFEPIRDRIRFDKGIIRSHGPDYLLYTLMDAVIDHYFLIIETLGEKIESIEESLFGQSNDNTVLDILNLKKEALKIRRSIFPLREVVSKLEKAETNLVQDKMKNYFRDLYDHTIQVIETIEIYRDMLWGLMDMHMTNISNKMNEVMKVLTIVATIFIPLTFIAGIYGMNFENMPELKSEYGYPVFWGVIITLFSLMFYYFKRKKWL